MRFIGKIKEDIKNVGTAITGFFANRRLSEEESLKYDRYTPKNWHQRLSITPPGDVPPASGLGYTQSPYIGQFTVMWGVNPLADLGKYRLMYRTVPIIKKAIDKTVATAVSKGFKLELDEDAPNREEILNYLTQWISMQEDFKTHMQMLASDALTYGNAYAEIAYDEDDIEEKYADELKQYTVPDPKENYKFGENSVPYIQEVTIMNDGKYTEARAKGNPVWIKPLDPMWVRVRRDSFGNCFGFLQYLSTPPVAFTTEKMVHIRYNAKSWWTENAYGTSALQSLIRTQEAIWTIENDLILISHACAKPPLIFACGSEEEPWTEGQLTQFVSETGGRGPGGDIYHRGDVEAKPLPFPASSLAPLIAHLDYHVEQRIVALGVPPDLLGIHASSNRSVATVSMDDWINTIQLLQEQIADAFEEQLFKVIVERKFGKGAPIPRIVWNQIYEKDQLGEVNTIIALRGANIITLNEARVWLEEIGKKLHPVEGGNIFGTPQVTPPEPNEIEEDGIDAQISKIDEGVDAFESSFKSEYTDLERESYVYTPEREDDLVNGIIEEEAKASDEFVSPGLDIDVPNQLMYPLLGDPKKKSTHTASEQNVRLEKLLDFDEIEFWKVSSDKVAELYDPKWKHNDENGKWIGGHHYVFEYVPKNEIWISDQDTEPKKTMVHEYIEMKLMKEKGMSYAEAHQIASAAEGNLSEVKQYIPPEKVEEKLDEHLEKIWVDPKGRKVIFDQKKGEISLVVDGLVKKSKLVRSDDDVEKFIKKLKSKFVGQ